MAEVTLTYANFEQEVIKADKTVLVDFWASWCGPCKMVAPIVAQIAEEHADRIKVGKVNVDEEMELASLYKIVSIPTLLVFKDGALVNQAVGYMPKTDIEKLLGL